MQNHGGNIYEAALELKIPERKVIDFSASVNPLGISKKIKAELRKHLKYLPNYPDPDCRRLRWHLSKRLEIPDRNILCGNGSTELLYLVIRELRPECALIPAPTFSEFERTLKINDLHNSVIKFYPLKAEVGFKLDVNDFSEAMRGCDMVFLCNPNNPTGNLITKEDMIRLASEAKKSRCYLFLDEAFLDFAPENSLDHSMVKEALNNPFLIILRSMTKFYALSGLRLGYIVADNKIIEHLKEKKEPWTVNILAQRAGVIAIRDKIYINQTFEYLKKEKKFIENSLKKNNILFYPSKVNYYLLKDDRSHLFLKYLREKGILLRDCSNFRGLDKSFIRISVRTHRENSILFKELKNVAMKTEADLR